MSAKLGSALLVAGLCVSACGSSSSTGSGGAGGQGGSAGAGGDGGTAGTGGVLQPTDKADLLLMVDNSISMADKQALLQEAVPRLINRLVNPPAGAKPLVDLRIGVITSSLGGHGGDACDPTSSLGNPTQDDKAHLIPSVRTGLESHANLGFLWWDPFGKGGGETNLTTLIGQFIDHVMATGEIGCGYEAPLEAWYRFLVDPAPPASVEVVNNVATLGGVDDALLKQRSDFLRPDSALAIIMLTDENDCSIVDGGVSWIAAQITTPNNQQFHLPRATSACASDPDGPCCRSCASSESAPPAGCTAVASDPQCQLGPWDDAGDHPNLRCWQQKKRFGIDFLYPTRKYSEALSQPTICKSWTTGAAGDGSGSCAGERVPNPLFAGGRDPRLVFLTGIVGVPWQDLATPDTLPDPSGLKLMTTAELAAMGRWGWLVPDCVEQVPLSELERPMSICKRWSLSDSPDDPFMIEATSPRTGTNPATKEPVAGPSAGPMASSINGHDWSTSGVELQYSCIFPLAVPRDCSSFSLGCDCYGATSAQGNPLCQDASGAYSSMQRYAKAYPGTRQLQVLRDLGEQAVVASICAKSVDVSKGDAYGYNAAMDALAERLDPVVK